MSYIAFHNTAVNLKRGVRPDSSMAYDNANNSFGDIMVAFK